MADLGNVSMDAPLYCIACIGEMERLHMGTKQYRKYRKLC